MHRFQLHLRNTFLAGALAAVPVFVTIFICWYVDDKTRAISSYLFGRSIPVVGILIAVAAIYFCGLAATTLLGKFFLKILDRLISRLPVVRPIYMAWKQIALTPGGTEGTFSHVALIPDETGATHLLGFTSGRSIEGNADVLCVFIPTAPNPVQGRLYLVHRSKCALVDMSPEEAFKVILSTGNYVPAAVGQAMKLFEPQEN